MWRQKEFCWDLKQLCTHNGTIGLKTAMWPYGVQGWLSWWILLWHVAFSAVGMPALCQRDAARSSKACYCFPSDSRTRPGWLLFSLITKSVLSCHLRLLRSCPNGQMDKSITFLFCCLLPLRLASISPSPDLSCLVLFPVHCGISKVRVWLSKSPPGQCDGWGSKSKIARCSVRGSGFGWFQHSYGIHMHLYLISFFFLTVLGPEAFLWLRLPQDTWLLNEHSSFL